MSNVHRQPDFNSIARVYRWMEYLSFGPMLERCRFAQIPTLGNPQHALVLGDGDGRFLARLLDQHPTLTADLIDLSPAMIGLAKTRVRKHHARAIFHVADIRSFPLPEEKAYDLVAAHFLLDCLSDSEVCDLLQRLAPCMAPDATLIVSEFAIPAREPLRSIGRLLVSSLYFAFQLLTRLEVRRLPNYASSFRQAGLSCEENKQWLGGILRSERWRFTGNSRARQATAQR